MADLHQRTFPCPAGCHNKPEWKATNLDYSFEYRGKEIWWCAECKEHFVREGDEFYRLLKR